MSLFDYTTNILSSDYSTQIDIPSGKILTVLSIGSDIPTAQKTNILPSGVRVISWSLPKLEAELALVPFHPDLPKGMSVVGCAAAIWRVKPKVSGIRPNFKIFMKNESKDKSFEADSGEGLEATTGDINKYRVSIGTEDGECLQSRARCSQKMPLRLASAIDISFVQHTDNGLQCQFPELLIGELVQVQFIVAWNQYTSNDDDSTWFAVDQKADMIFDQGGLG